MACALAQLMNTIDALLTLSLAWFVNIPTGGASVVSSLHCGHGELSAVMAHHFNLALDAQVVVPICPSPFSNAARRFSCRRSELNPHHLTHRSSPVAQRCLVLQAAVSSGPDAFYECQRKQNGMWLPPYQEDDMHQFCLLYTSPSPRDS